MAACEQVASTDSKESLMSSLPDDALLSVLRWLSMAELLAARAVCRRWRVLALHPDVWRHRRLNRRQPLALRRAALRLAPCAAFLRLNESDLKAFGALLVCTGCAVVELEIYDVDSNITAMLAAMVIHCQAALQRLLRLSVNVFVWEENPERWPALVDLLAEMHRVEGLTKLEVTLSGGTDFKLPGWAGSAVPAEPLPASLKELIFRAKKLFPHAAFQLRSHAATLTEVSLFNVRWPSGPLAEVLQNIAGLRTLHCPLVDDMRPLLQLSQLRTLGLYPGYSAEAASSASIREAVVENAKSFFRKATKLRHLRLVFRHHGQFAAELVGALGSSGRSELHTLTLVDGRFSVDVYCNMHMTGLPSLRDLVFLADEDDDMKDTIPPNVFEALATVSVPSLRAVHGYAEKCAHSLAHEPALAAAMRRNPRLHVLTSNLCCLFDDEDQCASCTQQCDCDPGFAPEGGRCGICGHSESDDDNCSVADHEDDYYDVWARVLPEQA